MSCIAHVYQFGTFGATAPWVYGLIAFGVALVVAVHVYRTVRKRRARDKVLTAAAGKIGRPILPIPKCLRQTCPVMPDSFHPSECPTQLRIRCPAGVPDLQEKSDV